MSTHRLEQLVQKVASLSIDNSFQIAQVLRQVRREAVRFPRQVSIILPKIKEKLRLARRMNNLDKSLIFDNLCFQLERNDPTTTTIFASTPHKGGSLRLRNALQNNTQVSTIQFYLYETDDEHQFLLFMEPLLSYIQTSQSIRHVTICWSFSTGSSERLQTAVLGAVFDNPDNVQALTLSPILLSIALFCNGLQSTKLKNLHVHFDSLASYSVEERDMIAVAFRCSTSLESLALVAGDADMVTCIMTALTDGLVESEYKLRELSVDCRDGARLDYLWALEAFTHATKHLKHLRIEEDDLDEEEFASYLKCVTFPSTVSKLTLYENSIDSGLMWVLQSFLKMRNPSEASSLHELEFIGTMMDIDDYREDDQPHNRYHADLMGSWLGTMFCMERDDTDQKWYPTIGSHLDSLSIEHPYNGSMGFVRALAQHGQHIGLKRLTLKLDLDPDYCRDYCKDLARFLGMTTSLRNLELDGKVEVNVILGSLRCNGTLHSVSIPDDHDFDSERATRYTLRNMEIGPLMQEYAELKPDNRSISFYPSLLEVAKQTPMTRAATMLSSLLLFEPSAESSQRS
jgi:hypothetical protein